MAEFVDARGNLLEADADALVNTVNTVGVMGKGIALQFKKAYPAMFKDYERACKRGDVQLGAMHIFTNGLLERPRFIINFPTKAHWRSKSKLADIDSGLDALAKFIVGSEIDSIALPPLGCGHGGLHWSQVEPLIRAKLANVDAVVHLYSPSGAPAAAKMPDARLRPELTPGKAALVAMISRYSEVAMSASVIEVQKLMYFLQAAGQDLRLNYRADRYGPYADNLRHVLHRLEGHHLSGYGDGSTPVLQAEPITVRPGAMAEAEAVIAQMDDENALEGRIDRSLSLAEGFESAYGLELLASVHWCASGPGGVDSPEAAMRCVHSWSTRKSRLFTQDHVDAAWHRLTTQGWLQSLEEGLVG